MSIHHRQTSKIHHQYLHFHYLVAYIHRPSLYLQFYFLKKRKNRRIISFQTAIDIFQQIYLFKELCSVISFFFKWNHTWIHFDTKFVVTWQLNKFLVKKNWYEINFKRKTNFKLREQKNMNTKICIGVVRAIDRMSALSVLGHETYHSRLKITDTNQCTPMLHHLKHCVLKVPFEYWWCTVLYMQSTESEMRMYQHIDLC